MMHFRILFAFLIYCIVIPAFGQGGMSKERLKRLDNFLEAKIKQGELPGAVCKIWRKGEMVKQQTYGTVHTGSDMAMAEDGIFFIQSMTKPIVSVALMILYEEGLFDLNDPVAKYLPQFAHPQVLKMEDGQVSYEEAKNPITIAQVFAHTGGFLHGLSDWELDRRYAETLYRHPYETVQDRVNAMATLPLAAEPGTKWYYSAGPDILAVLVEQFSGKKLDVFLKERIFDPLGMKDTGYNLTPEQAKRYVGLNLQEKSGQQKPYPKSDDPKYVVKDTTTGFFLAASGNTVFGGTHGLFSTAADYMKFCRMMLNQGELDGKRILGRKTVELMTDDHAKAAFSEKGGGFGLGFGVRTDLADQEALGSVGQYYWSGLFNTYFFIDPKEELIGILMMQFYPYNGFYNMKFRQLVYQAIVD